MTDRELMQQALDALEYVIQSVGGNAPESFDVWFQKTQVPAEALRARLKQPEQPQIVWIDNKQTGNFLNITPPQREEGCAECGKQASEGWALYCVECIELAREWQGLTDEEIQWCYEEGNPLRAIEAKLKEKNNG